MSKEEDWILNEEGEEALGECIIRYLEHANPNPERKGCPDTKIIRALAFHEKLDPKVVRKVALHMTKCSECMRESGIYVEEYNRLRYPAPS